MVAAGLSLRTLKGAATDYLNFMQGKLIIVDGIDGSGKGVVVQTLAEWAEKKKLRVLNLKDYCRKFHTFPEIDTIKKYDVLISCEPTYALVGKALREEIIRDNTRLYSALSTAMAFALDREILYRRVIIPAMAEGKIIFQERGVTTSLIYQPVQAEPLGLQKIMSLHGNALTLRYRPHLLIITKLQPEVAMQRLKQRIDKRDASIFEKLNFLRRVNRRFQSTWFRDLFAKKGTKVVYLDTGKTLRDTKQKTLQIWTKFLCTTNQ